MKWEAACAGTSTRNEKSSAEGDGRSRRGEAAAVDAGLRVLECVGDAIVPREREDGGAEKEICLRYERKEGSETLRLA